MKTISSPAAMRGFMIGSTHDWGLTDLIIADELGYISFDREAADLLFTVLSLRASQKSTIITSNLTFERWDEIFGDAAITSAIVDRLTYKAYLIDMEGDSYRLRETLRSNGTDFETVVK